MNGVAKKLEAIIYSIFKILIKIDSIGLNRVNSQGVLNAESGGNPGTLLTQYSILWALSREGLVDLVCTKNRVALFYFTL
jgi:hypothetical protein